MNSDSGGIGARAGWDGARCVEVQYRLLDGGAGPAPAIRAAGRGRVGADLEHLDVAEGDPQPGQRQGQLGIKAAVAAAGHGVGVTGGARAL